MAQDEREIEQFAELLAAEGVKRYLEIGSKFGGSLWRIGTRLTSGVHIVSVDMPYGTRLWAQSQASLKACLKALEALGHSTRLILGDSTQPETIHAVTREAPFDAVLIDANHTLPFVRQDWANYAPLARIVAFHDINWHRAPTWVGTRIDVPEFWREIKGDYRTQEICLCPTGKNNGIGVLWRH
jgi:predicted O-methyltransferase YrrM